MKLSCYVTFEKWAWHLQAVEGVIRVLIDARRSLFSTTVYIV